MSRKHRLPGTALAVALLAALLTPLPAAASTCPAEVSTSAPIERVGGPDRYATAACMSQAVYPGGADHVLLARGDAAGGLADALTGTVLAHALDAPILLTRPDRLVAPARDELDRLAPERVTLLGGARAISPAVAEAVEALGVTVDRVSGADRYATAVAVADEADAGPTAFVVNGRRPADALVAAAPAARAGAALLLVGTEAIPDVTAGALAGADDAVIVGGHGVVSETVAAQLRRLFGSADVRRVAGGNRGETAASVARAFPAPGHRYLANGTDTSLVDAVTAGWAAALPGGGPVLYTGRDAPGRPADRHLRLGGLGSGDALEPVRLVGGSAVLSDALVDALEVRYDEARAGGPAPEVRALWVHLFDSSLKVRGNVHRVLDAAAAAGLNTVVVQVARRQDSYYTSDVLPRTVDPAMSGGLDLLDFLVPAAHDRGLAVHAWVSVLPAYHNVYDGLDLGPDHVWRRHGPGTGEPWTTRRDDGASSVFLDPGVPGVQDHVAAVLAEIAERYPVDAVHVDYLRYDGERWGYHPTSLQRFRAQTGASGTPAPDDASWGAWRRDQTRDLARRIHLEVADADPDVAVSLAASTMGDGPVSAGGYTQTRTYSDVFQDWPSWYSGGLIDAAFPMNYFRENVPEQRRWFDEWVAFEGGLRQDGRPLAVGQAAYLNTVAGSLAQLTRARTATDGVVVYSYQQNTVAGDPQGLLAALPQTLFADPAPAPPLPQRRADRGNVLVQASDGANVELRGVTVRADATGHAGFLRVVPGTWTVTADGHLPREVTVTAGEVARVTLPRR